jgi:hypothetical protein
MVEGEGGAGFGLLIRGTCASMAALPATAELIKANAKATQ